MSDDIPATKATDDSPLGDPGRIAGEGSVSTQEQVMLSSEQLERLLALPGMTRLVEPIAEKIFKFDDSSFLDNGVSQGSLNNLKTAANNLASKIDCLNNASAYLADNWRQQLKSVEVVFMIDEEDYIFVASNQIVVTSKGMRHLETGGVDDPKVQTRRDLEGRIRDFEGALLHEFLHIVLRKDLKSEGDLTWEHEIINNSIIKAYCYPDFSFPAG